MISFLRKIKVLFCGDRDGARYDDINCRALHIVTEHINEIEERLGKIMSALNNLQEAINRLSKATDAAVTELNTPHPSEEAIQAAADLVNAQAGRLEVAVGVVVETPPPVV